MKYKNLGRTGIKVSEICLGTMNFGGRTPKDEANKIMNLAIDSGINIIDSANVYGHNPSNFEEGRGRSEQIIGEFLNKNDYRDDLVISSKVRFPMGSGINNEGISRFHIKKQIYASLSRLQLDYIDLYQLHSAMNSIPIDETLRALDELIYQDKIQYIGTSGFSAWQLVESIHTSTKLGLNRFISEQPAYNLLDRRIERELVPMAKTYGLGLLTWSPLAGGFLAGVYKDKNSIPDNSRFDKFWRGTFTMFDERAFSILSTLQEIADSKDCTIDQLSLAWILSREYISSVIIGPRTTDQLKSNLKATEIKLSSDDLKLIDEVAVPFRMVSSFYGPDVKSGFGHIRWGPSQYSLN